MTDSEREQARRDELVLVLVREGVSLAVMCAVLLLMSPKVQIWVRQKLWRVRKLRDRRHDHEEAMVALLRRELSRDLPLVERGMVDP